MSLALLSQQNAAVARRRSTALLQQQRGAAPLPDTGIHPIVRGVTQADVTDQGTHYPFPAADLFAPEWTPIYAPEDCTSERGLYEHGGYAVTLHGWQTGRWYYLAHGAEQFFAGQILRGAQIGSVGSTGTGPGGYDASGGTSPHLHLALSSDGDFSRGHRGGSGDIWPTPDLWEMAVAEPVRYWSVNTIAVVSQCPAAAIAENWPLVRSALERQRVTSKENQAAAIGTIAIETASTFRPVREAFWLSEAWRRANLRYYPYYGRGEIQLTWEDNYRAAGDYLGIDLVSNPDRALEPDIASEVFAWYWTVARPTIPANADAWNWREVRRLVQGGSSGLDRLVSIAETLLG